MTAFWRSWLTLWCIGVGVFGLILYGVGFPATTGLARVVFAAFGNPLPAEPDRYLRFTTSLMGAVTAGWAVTYYAAFRAAWALDGGAGATVWRVLTLSAGLRYAIDSFASATTGFPLNVVSNTVLMILYLIPVLVSGVLVSAAVAQR